MRRILRWLWRLISTLRHPLHGTGHFIDHARDMFYLAFLLGGIAHKHIGTALYILGMLIDRLRHHLHAAQYFTDLLDHDINSLYHALHFLVSSPYTHTQVTTLHPLQVTSHPGNRLLHGQ